MSDAAQIADRLLVYLQGELHAPTLTYADPPTPLRGGYETSIYAFKLRDGPPAFGGRLVLRLYAGTQRAESALRESQVQSILAQHGVAVARAHLTCTNPSILGGAFFIMDFVPGEHLVTVPLGTMPRILGETHAELHRRISSSVLASLTCAGIPEDDFRLGQLNGTGTADVNEFTWAYDIIAWLKAHHPTARSDLTLCHGDFHPLNILAQAGAVTGILDWTDARIAEPAWDVARTILRLTLAFKHLVSPAWGRQWTTVDWDEIGQAYRYAYEAANPSGTANLGYHEVEQRVLALAEGARGHPVWRYPPITQQIIEAIQSITGIRITIPW